jgi:uncharacterized OsmC-like protein
MICNGIDTGQLAAFGELVVDDPRTAIASARVRTRWEERYRTRVSTEEFAVGGERVIRGATLTLDRPRVLGGGDGGPAPGELVLAALGSCVAQAFLEEASMSGVEVERFELSAEGHLDLRGNVGVEGVRPGITRIDLDVEVESSAGPEVLDGLLAGAVRRSPVADSLAAGVQIDAMLRQPQPGVAATSRGGLSDAHR